MRNLLLVCLLLFGWVGKAQNTQKPVELKGHAHTIKQLCYASDKLVSLDEGGMVKVWDVAQRKCLRTLASEERAHYIALSPDRTQILALTSHAMLIWDINTDVLLRKIATSARWQLRCAVYAADGKQVYALAEQDNRKSWRKKTRLLTCDLATGKYKEKELADALDFGYYPSLRRDAQGNLMLAELWVGRSSESAQGISCINPRTGKRLYKLQSDAKSVDLSADGMRLVCDGKEGKVEFWDVAGKNRDEMRKLSPDYANITHIALHPTKPFAAVSARAIGGADKTPQELFIVPASPDAKIVWIGNFPTYSAVSFDPEGNTLAVGGESGNIVLYDVRKICGQTTEITAPKEPTLADRELPRLMPKIPVAKTKNPDAVAVIIGNTRYQKAKNVSFAQADAQLMKQYLIHTLGFSEGNILYQEDATLTDFRTIFGDKENHKGKLFNMVRAGKSDVFVYYVGHGAPSLNSGKGFFVPVESEPAYIDLSGYDMEVFYQNIAKVPAKSLTIVLDACFSGVNLYENISPIVVKPKGIQALKNAAILSACKEEEVAGWYNAEKHGLFTFFFLQALQDYQRTDANQDKQITMEEIWQRISHQTQGLPYYARLFHNIAQNPTLQGDRARVVMTYE